MAGRFRRLLFGERSGAKTPKGSGRMATDPVCGMDVDEDRAAATSEYGGKTYYFCAVGCKKAFDKDPERYLNEATSMHRSEH